MMEDAMRFDMYFSYLDANGENKIIFNTSPDVQTLRAAPAIWMRLKDQPLDQSQLQVQGFAASIITLGINHYWHERDYFEGKPRFPEPAKLEDLDFFLFCKKTEVFRSYMNAFAPIAHEVWECSPTLPLECSEGDNWYTYLYACECDARQAFLQSELYQCLNDNQRRTIYGYTSRFIDFLAKNYPVSIRTQHRIMEALSRDIPPIQLHLETKTQIIRKKEFCKKLSTFLVPQSDPCMDDDDVQTHLEEAAKGSATDLANYLSSEEGQRHFNFRNMSRPQVLAILNEECHTDIKEDTFYRACNKCNLAFPNNAMQGTH